MKKSLLLLPLIFILLPQKAYSQNTNSTIPNRGNIEQQVKNRPEERRELKEEVQNKMQEKAQERCAQVEGRIRQRTENFYANREHHVERYGEFKGKIQDVVIKLRTRGYDTGQLETDLVEFDNLTQTYAGEYIKFINLLEGSSSLACGESQGAFRESLQESRDQLVVARTARREVWEFYKDTIREDIKEIRQQAELLETETL